MKEVKSRPTLSLVRFQPESKEIFYFGGWSQQGSRGKSEKPCWLTSPDDAMRFYETGDVAAIARQLKCECWTFFDANQDIPEDMEALLESAVTMFQQHRQQIEELTANSPKEVIVRDQGGNPRLTIAQKYPDSH